MINAESIEAAGVIFAIVFWAFVGWMVILTIMMPWFVWRAKVYCKKSYEEMKHLRKINQIKARAAVSQSRQASPMTMPLNDDE